MKHYYKNLVDKLDDNKIIELLLKLGAKDIINKSNCIITNTICHNDCSDEASQKLYYYKNTHMFYCYTSCQSMSIFIFLKNYYLTRNIEFDWYDDIVKVVEDCSNFDPNQIIIEKRENLRNKFNINRNIKELPEINKNLLDCFIKYYPPEWLKEGISKEAMDKYNILYSISQNKIIIPHYDINNRLIGIRGRALNDWEIENVGKYMPIQIENNWYSHPLSLNLYGLNLNKENIKKTGICYLCEAEKSILQLESFPILNCGVAVCGSNFNKYALNILLKECMPKEIIICFDNEEIKGENKYFNKLYNIGKKYLNYCDFSFIYDRKGITKLKDSPTDRGFETFKKLLEQRVKIR